MPTAIRYRDDRSQRLPSCLPSREIRLRRAEYIYYSKKQSRPHSTLTGERCAPDSLLYLLRFVPHSCSRPELAYESNPSRPARRTPHGQPGDHPIRYRNGLYRRRLLFERCPRTGVRYEDRISLHIAVSPHTHSGNQTPTRSARENQGAIGEYSEVESVHSKDKCLPLPLTAMSFVWAGRAGLPPHNEKLRR